MKLKGLAAPPDKNAAYKEISDALKADTTGQCAVVDIGNEDGVPDTKESLTKALQTLRSGMAKVGRFTVKSDGQTAYVSINKSDPQKRSAKKSPAPPAAPKTPKGNKVSA